MTKKKILTAAGKRRMESIHELVKELAKGPMRRDKISEFLKVGPTYGRGLTLQMERDGLIIGTKFSPNIQCNYSLNPNAAFVAQILAFRYTPPSEQKNAAGIKTGRIVVETPVSHIYVMAEDEKAHVKTNIRIPAPDPLLAHLFGRAAA